MATKLKQLIEVVSASLGDPLPSTRTLANELRRAGVISQRGRGVHAADMRAEDAAALLVVSLCFANATAAADTWKVVGGARLSRCKRSDVETEGDIEWETAFPPLECIRSLGPSHTFGEVVSALLQGIIDRSPLLDNRHLWFMRFSVSRTPLNWSASIDFTYCGVDESEDLYDCRCSLEYFAGDPEFSQCDSEEWSQVMDRLFIERGRKIVAMHVDGAVLFTLADCLRGTAISEEAGGGGNG